MLALQSAPLHLRDQEKQERRFDQSLLFAAYPTTLHHHHQQVSSPPSSSQQLHRHHPHHPRHHSYNQPSQVPSMPHSQPNSTRHHQHQALFYRECDLKQDLSIANAKVSNHISSSGNGNGNNNHCKNNQFAADVAAHSTTATAAQYTPWIQDQDDMFQHTPIQKIEARISQMTMDDYAKEKIVLLLT
ncbi:hypothetical protein BGX27_004043, partial [Mortierella sp. AM989]